MSITAIAAAALMMAAPETPDAAATPAPQAAPLPQTTPAPDAAPAAEQAPSPPADAVPVVEDDQIIVTAKPLATPGDPLEQLNAKSFEVIQSVDKAVVGPVALAYRDDVPHPIRRGAHNFLYNLGEPVVFVNFLLQLKIGKAVETAGRFAINSTIGGAGLFDVAKKKPFHLPHRPNGFAYTMGFYGIKPGAYLYLPLIGPTTVRDLTGRLMDLSFLPFAVGAPFNNIAYTLPAGTLNALDDRAEFDDEMQKIRASDDPYAAERDYYMTKRQAEIDALRGKPSPQKQPDQAGTGSSMVNTAPPSGR